MLLACGGGLLWQERAWLARTSAVDVAFIHSNAHIVLQQGYTCKSEHIGLVAD